MHNVLFLFWLQTASNFHFILKAGLTPPDPQRWITFNPIYISLLSNLLSFNALFSILGLLSSLIPLSATPHFNRLDIKTLDIWFYAFCVFQVFWSLGNSHIAHYTSPLDLSSVILSKNLVEFIPISLSTLDKVVEELLHAANDNPITSAVTWRRWG